MRHGVVISTQFELLYRQEMDQRLPPSGGPPSEVPTSSPQPNRSKPDLASPSSLYHKLSLATTHSTTSTSAKQIPIYIRIVPKDIWIRIHLDPKQTIASVKDTALIKVNAPESDPSLNYRFYQDAVNASGHAKIAAVASQDKVVKHRSWALPRTFVTRAVELGHVEERVAGWLRERVRKQGYRDGKGKAKLSSMKSRTQIQQQRVGGSSSSARTASDDIQVTRQISNSTLATSPPSTPSDLGVAAMQGGGESVASDTSVSEDSQMVNEIAIDLDVSLITGNRDAKLEEELARMRLRQWNSTSSQSDGVLGKVDSTPTIGSSNFDSESASSNPSGQYFAGTPPRRPPRSEQRKSQAEPASFYTQPGAAESFNSLASIDSPSSAEFVTTVDDERGVMRWGTQAEPSSMAVVGAGVGEGERLVGMDTSPVRPRSRTVTAADVRSRNTGVGEEAPMLPAGFSSPVRISSLPRTKMVAEESQRRTVSNDLLAMLRGDAPCPSPSTTTHLDYEEEEESDDQEIGFSTVPSPRLAPGGLRKKSSEGSAIAGLSSPSSTHSHSHSHPAPGYIAGIRLDEISRSGWGKQVSHPLSAKFAVISSTNGCEMEEWKTVAAYDLRPYELLELQWMIPTERVYIPPIAIGDVIRPPSTTSSSGGRKIFNTTGWDVGPEIDSVCLEPFFEGWVYVMKPEKGKKAKWKLHFVTVKGWRMDLYRKKPRAGEAILPLADQTWSLRGVEWVLESESAVPSNTALPSLEGLPSKCLSVGFASKHGGSGSGGGGGGMVGSPNTLSSTGLGTEGSVLTIRCINGFDHESLSSVLVRAWYRVAATSSGVDMWRRKAVFRAIVAGRGGTVPAGRAGRGKGSRNSKARTRLRPSGWPKEWEDADLWSSESETEQCFPPPELVARLEEERERRGTVTQIKVDKAGRRDVDNKVVVAGGLYAALLGRSVGNAVVGEGSVDSSPYHQGSTNTRRREMIQKNQEPGLMLGSGSQHHHSVVDRRMERQRSGSLTWSPDPTAATSAGEMGNAGSKTNRSRSVTVSTPSPGRGRSNPSSTNSSRNVSREASPLPGATRKGGGGGYAMSPALVPGFVDVPPPPSVALLRKYKASTKQQQQSE